MNICVLNSEVLMADNYISRRIENGTINISEDVVAALVKTSATEVEGFAEFVNASGADLADFIGVKMNRKGVKIHLTEDKIIVDAVITVKYGFNIVEVASKIQEAAASAIQLSTGFEETEVNVHVAGIAF